MSRDFTVKIFRELLNAFQAAGYTFITYSEYCAIINTQFPEPCAPCPMLHALCPERFVILRHDVDALPGNSLRLAQLENSLGIRGTYYFRARQDGFEEVTIRRIAALGHEIGYHYETINQVLKQQYAADSNQSESVLQKLKTLWYSVLNSVLLSRLVGTSRVTKKKQPLEEEKVNQAYNLFINNLEKLRKIVPVSTICMHGSPLSRYDNRAIWEKYDYHSLDIAGDPYFDIDFNKMAYLTDTGRRWNGNKTSVRDKVESQYKFNFKSTNDIIRNMHMLPDKVMLNLHPQRWNNAWIPWLKEIIWQNLKNPVKWLLIKIKS